MPDREKVIKGLCDAIGLIHGYAPKRYWGYGEQACRDAISLLKKQEPKLVRIDEDSVHCPSCGNELFTYPRQKFCDECGQELKWE